MICNYCGNEHDKSIMEIIISKGTIHYFCPNCRTILAQAGALKLEEIMDVDYDIQKTPGAIIFKSGKEEYHLKKDTMKRLLLLNLLPEEYKALKTEKYQYMLHCDFYSTEGIALQPIPENTTKPYFVSKLSLFAYELYKQDWLNIHISPERLLKAKRDFAVDCIENNNNETVFEEWIEEYGFNGEIYACFEEFLVCEYEDEQYMIRLLEDEKLIQLYENR